MRASNSSWKSTFLALLQPLGAAIGALFAFGVLIIATRQGQFSSIAAFGAGAGVAAIVSVVVGGGTTLAYTTGTIPRQRAVRVVRSVIVLPAVTLAIGIAVVAYSVWGYLDALAVMAGGLSTLASVGAELDASYLRRRLRTGRLFTADVLNRLLAFGLIVLGVPFAFAMLGGALSRALLLRLFTRSDPSRTRELRIDKPALALAYEAKMTSLSVLYSACDRIGALAAPVVMPVSVAGGFVAVLSAQQNVSGVLLTGLQTTLAARSQQRKRLNWANHLDLLFVGGGLMVAAVMIAAQEPLVRFLGLDGASQPGLYWIALALLIPASLTSRLFEFRFLSSTASHKAVAARSIAALVALGAAALVLSGSDPSILSGGLLIAEVASVLTSVTLLAAQHVRDVRGRGNA